MKRQQRRSASEWAAVVEQWQGSGLTAEEFGRRNNINGKVLSWWKWHLARHARGGRPESTRGRRNARLLPVQVVSTGTESSKHRAPLQLEVVVRGGRMLRLSVGSNAEVLSLIRLLEDSVPC